MQLPILSSLTTLLSGSVTDTFKDLFKPTALVSAAFLSILHLVLVLPPLRDSGVAPLLAVEALPTVWQVTLGTIFFFMLAYILHALGGFFLSLLDGTTLRGSYPGEVLEGRQTKRYDALLQPLRQLSPSHQPQDLLRRASRAAYQLAREFPEEDNLKSTGLGNALAAVATYTNRQYGAHLDTIWPLLDLVLKKEAPDLREQIEAHQDAMSFLATLSVLSGAVAVELALVTVAFNERLGPLGWCLALAIAAWVFYRTTVLKAKAWGLAVRTAFNVHLDKAGDLLGLRKLEDPAARRARWKAVSEWLAIGALAVPEDVLEDLEPLQTQDAGWYSAPAKADPPDVEFPPTVSVQTQSRIVSEWDSGALSPSSWRLPGCEIEYVVAVSNKRATTARGVYLRVTDSRLPALPVLVRGTVEFDETTGEARYSRREAAANGQQESLLWLLGDLAPRATCVLHYRVRYEVRFAVTGGAATIDAVMLISENDSYFLTIDPTPTDGTNVTLTVAAMNERQAPSRIRLVGGGPVMLSTLSDQELPLQQRTVEATYGPFPVTASQKVGISL